MAEMAVLLQAETSLSNSYEKSTHSADSYQSESREICVPRCLPASRASSMFWFAHFLSESP
jgi:hypothetical protein